MSAVDRRKTGLAGPGTMRILLINDERVLGVAPRRLSCFTVMAARKSRADVRHVKCTHGKLAVNWAAR